MTALSTSQITTASSSPGASSNSTLPSTRASAGPSLPRHQIEKARSRTKRSVTSQTASSIDPSSSLPSDPPAQASKEAFAVNAFKSDQSKQQLVEALRSYELDQALRSICDNISLVNEDGRMVKLTLVDPVKWAKERAEEEKIVTKQTASIGEIRDVAEADEVENNLGGEETSSGTAVKVDHGQAPSTSDSLSTDGAGGINHVVGDDVDRLLAEQEAKRQKKRGKRIRQLQRKRSMMLDASALEGEVHEERPEVDQVESSNREDLDTGSSATVFIEAPLADVAGPEQESEIKSQTAAACFLASEEHQAATTIAENTADLRAQVISHVSGIIEPVSEVDSGQQGQPSLGTHPDNFITALRQDDSDTADTTRRSEHSDSPGFTEVVIRSTENHSDKGNTSARKGDVSVSIPAPPPTLTSTLPNIHSQPGPFVLNDDASPPLSANIAARPRPDVSPSHIDLLPVLIPDEFESTFAAVITHDAESSDQTSTRSLASTEVSSTFQLPESAPRASSDLQVEVSTESGFSEHSFDRSDRPIPLRKDTLESTSDLDEIGTPKLTGPDLAVIYEAEEPEPSLVPSIVVEQESPPHPLRTSIIESAIATAPTESFHPLASSWTLFYSSTASASSASIIPSRAKVKGAAEYSHGLFDLFSYSNLEDLFGAWKALRRRIAMIKQRPIEDEGRGVTKGLEGLGIAFMPDDANFHFFKTGVKPMWEDPMCAKGGKIMAIGTLAQLDLTFQKIVLLLSGDIIGNEVPSPPGSFVVGAVLSKRKMNSRVEIWLGGSKAPPLEWVQAMDRFVRNEVPEVKCFPYRSFKPQG
ncbi:hypothetical protein BD324DRAFT_638422 [Kockovaella imperatae]|uniref:Translation initiation factor eIF 4e-like domain-containing protein n=1 Tax=Kockovaella imperatae TaxID=4999 RepID=A0A1Y1U873_9TREE|nr:hypothetical protein BD324DRAFT_638422 [Kockovaella imperatae]ORX33744.1 hypothetical protein BD324DRAFT_638422 [Kockovaella imperatae]